ncbi:hypothetical protein O181_039382 [Austropuccinia psidii MF-1]|uniref:Integrase zinc-binding domain-containing protein n=1 Tax=Austropuccinia psidii MF-1 TaxID=1389203 RepID=A0A9Q3DGP9_9BASI|nr:hypothetical protein [Austropuccinia psidii MF-1]
MKEDSTSLMESFLIVPNIDTILHESHDSVVSGHLSEDMTLERVKTCSWCPNWRNNVADYCKTCDGCQKAIRPTGKKFVMMIQNQEPKLPWEIFHMDCVTALTPGCNNHSPGVRVLINTPTQTPQISKSSICISIQFQQSSF